MSRTRQIPDSRSTIFTWHAFGAPVWFHFTQCRGIATPMAPLTFYSLFDTQSVG
jgi:hypothetical protein